MKWIIFPLLISMVKTLILVPRIFPVVAKDCHHVEIVDHPMWTFCIRAYRFDNKPSVRILIANFFPGHAVTSLAYLSRSISQKYHSALSAVAGWMRPIRRA